MASTSTLINKRMVSKLNTLPKKTPMQSAIEHIVLDSTRCFTCGSLVYAVEKRVTSNHVYHNRCFRCRICKRNLNGSTLNEDGDDIYCNNCYRKKERGECDSLEFQKATVEREQFVYNRRHPDQPLPGDNPRRPIPEDLSRQPSLTLHRFERQFTANEKYDPATSAKIKENYQKLISVIPSIKSRSASSVPDDRNSHRQGSLMVRADDPSPSLHFSPIFSPNQYVKIPSQLESPKTPKRFNDIKLNKNIKLVNLFKNTLPFRENQSNIDLTKIHTPSIERRKSILKDTSKRNETGYNNSAQIFRFPSAVTPSKFRRSSSAHSPNNKFRTKLPY